MSNLRRSRGPGHTREGGRGMSDFTNGVAGFCSRSRLALIIAAGIGTAIFGGVLGSAIAQQASNDWTQAGFDLAGSSSSTSGTGITAANVAGLSRHQVTLDGIVDASAIYLHGVGVKGGTHNVFFVTTSYGKTIAVDGDQGAILWEYTPPKYDSWAGSRQITNTTPVADPNRQNIYA